MLMKKSITQMLEQTTNDQGALKKSLGAFDLTMLGIGLERLWVQGFLS